MKNEKLRQKASKSRQPQKLVEREQHVTRIYDFTKIPTMDLSGPVPVDIPRRFRWDLEAFSYSSKLPKGYKALERLSPQNKEFIFVYNSILVHTLLHAADTIQRGEGLKCFPFPVKCRISGWKIDGVSYRTLSDRFNFLQGLVQQRLSSNRLNQKFVELLKALSEVEKARQASELKPTHLNRKKSQRDPGLFDLVRSAEKKFDRLIFEKYFGSQILGQKYQKRAQQLQKT